MPAAYARVDLLDAGGDLVVSELELVEPDLAPGRLVRSHRALRRHLLAARRPAGSGLILATGKRTTGAVERPLVPWRADGAPVRPSAPRAARRCASRAWPSRPSVADAVDLPVGDRRAAAGRAWPTRAWSCAATAARRVGAHARRPRASTSAGWPPRPRPTGAARRRRATRTGGFLAAQPRRARRVHRLAGPRRGRAAGAQRPRRRRLRPGGGRATCRRGHDRRPAGAATELGDALERYRPLRPRARPTPSSGCGPATPSGSRSRSSTSYHTVWFELHEDLLATLGLDRAPRRQIRRQTGDHLMGTPASARVAHAPWSRRSTTTAASTSTAPATLARWLVDHGNDGLVVAGTTGEAPDAHRRREGRAVAGRARGGRRPDRRRHRHPTTPATPSGCRSGPPRCGVDGAAAGRRRTTTDRPRPASRRHIRAVAEAIDLPIVMYDVPIRTGRAHRPSTRSSRWPTRCPNIVGLKDASGDPGAAARLVAEAPDDFDALPRRRRPDAAAAGRRRRRRRRRGHPLDAAS